MSRVPPILQSPLAVTAMGITGMALAALLTVAAAPIGTSSGGSGQVTALCSPTSRLSWSSPPPPADPVRTADATWMVGVILADTTSSTRHTLYDTPLWQIASGAGTTWDVQNAHGDAARFAQIAQGMIAEGVDILIIDSIDLTSGFAVEQEATAAGVTVIDADPVDLGGPAPCYISFDHIPDGAS